jgi:hypothetical protein
MLSYRVYVSARICMKRKFMVTCNTTLFDEKPAMKECFYTEDPTSKRTIKTVYSLVKSIVWNRLLRGIFGLNKLADKKIMHVICIRELRSLIPESYSVFLEDFLIFFHFLQENIRIVDYLNFGNSHFLTYSSKFITYCCTHIQS